MATTISRHHRRHYSPTQRAAALILIILFFAVLGLSIGWTIATLPTWLVSNLF